MLLLALSLACSLYGLIVIASATQTYDGGSAQYVIIQFVAIVLGVLMYALMTVIDVDVFADQWKWLYAVSALLLLLLIPFGQGQRHDGQQRLAPLRGHRHTAHGVHKAGLHRGARKAHQLSEIL